MLTEDAFVALWRSERPRLQRWLHGRVRNATVAQDLVAEAYARAWRHRHRWEPTAAPEAWLQTIAYNVLRDHLRSAAVRLASVFDVHVPLRTAADPAAADALEAAERRCDAQRARPLLVAALATRTETQRDILVARVLHDTPYADLAEQFGIDPGSVRCLMHRAVTGMRSALKATTADPSTRAA